MILLGLTNADGFFTQTQNAVNYYRNAYYMRNFGTYASLRTNDNSFSKYIEKSNIQWGASRKNISHINPIINSNISRHDRKYSGSRKTKFSDCI